MVLAWRAGAPVHPARLRLDAALPLNCAFGAAPPGRRLPDRWRDGLCGDDGIADFERLHSGAHDAGVVLYAFDLLAADIRSERLKIGAPSCAPCWLVQTAFDFPRVLQAMVRRYFATAVSSA
jgi:hypothetical protein